MSRTRLLFLLALGLGACADQPTAPPENTSFVRLADTDHGGRGFTVTLSGAEEAPVPNNSPGTGTFVMTINPGQGELCYELSVSGLTTPVTNAHIHIGPPGVAGPPVVQLIPPVTGFSSECVDVAAGLLRDIRKNPEAYYVNVHTTMFPGGEVRAQFGG